MNTQLNEYKVTYDNNNDREPYTNAHYNIKITDIEATLNTIANKYRGITLKELKQYDYEPVVKDLFVVLMDIYGTVNGNRIYFTDF